MRAERAQDRGTTAFLGRLFAALALVLAAALGLLAALGQTAVPAVTISGGIVLAAVGAAAWLARRGVARA